MACLTGRGDPFKQAFPFNSCLLTPEIQRQVRGLTGKRSGYVDTFFICQPRDRFGNNRTSLDSVDFQVSLEPLTVLPEFWLEYSAVMSPTDLVVTPRVYKKRGFFNVSMMIYPQVQRTKTTVAAPPSRCA